MPQPTRNQVSAQNPLHRLQGDQLCFVGAQFIVAEFKTKHSLGIFNAISRSQRKMTTIQKSREEGNFCNFSFLLNNHLV